PFCGNSKGSRIVISGVRAHSDATIVSLDVDVADRVVWWGADRRMVMLHMPRNELPGPRQPATAAG
ncbi:MAG: hypothetical protein ABI563_19535, partial [Specibacter sp.]